MIRILSAAALAIGATPLAAQTTNDPTDVPSAPASTLTISGGATLASQYRFRGISLSDENAAVQGTINVQHDSGAYAGAWASTLDGFGELGGADVEVDL